MRRIEIITCPDCGRLCDVSITEGMDGTAVQQICMGCGRILDAQTLPGSEGYYLDMGRIAPTYGDKRDASDGEERNASDGEERDA